MPATKRKATEDPPSAPPEKRDITLTLTTTNTNPPAAPGMGPSAPMTSEASSPQTTTEATIVEAETPKILETLEMKSDIEASDTTIEPPQPSGTSALELLKARRSRFESLKARQHDSRTANRRETHAEAQRLTTDPAELTALNRRRAIAAHKLSRAEAEADGEDFERKRAWDWTIEESEKWDRRMKKKQSHRDDNPFQDYSQNARKVYKRQLKQMGPADLEAYERSKSDAIERAAKSGRLEVVETDDGELVAVDKDGTFYSSAESTDFVKNRPDKAAVDRLVDDLKKADDIRMRKRRERGRQEEDGDITYINEKNKQFNMKLARFYNKYTEEIRENFERGTAI